jgi:SWI/SNF-related matrix-associated actin-dependent regulator of chromatin subfamily A-like protein 1
MSLETPFPYQLEGADYLAGKAHALLADEMGLGKSAQVIVACDIVGAFDILVVCPAAVRINWSREFTRFSPMDRPCTLIFTGKDKPGRGVNIVSYDLLASNEKLRNQLKALHWDVLVLDEAHYLKERSAKRTKALYGHAKHPGIMHSAKRCWRLSGTPAPNDASELFTHLKSAGIEKRPYWDFVYDFCSGFESDYGYKITGHKNTTKLKGLLAQFMLRRKKDEVMQQLPPITFSEVTVERSHVDLDPWFYENWRPIGVPAFLQEMKDIDSSLKTALNAIKRGHHHNNEDSVRLLDSFSKSTSTLRRYIGLAKLPNVLDIIEEELESGAIDKIVLFAIHQQVIEQTRTRFRKYKAVTLYGGTPTAKRQQNIDAFQNNPKCRVFIGQVVAAGTGITLTSAHEVAFIEADWVPANNAQAAMRCHRVGQTKPVRVRFFTCAGSVDEDVMRVVVHKTREIAKIID